MAIVLEFNSVDVTDHLLVSTLNIPDKLLTRGTASFTVKDSGLALGVSPGVAIIIKNGSKKVFVGSIENCKLFIPMAPGLEPYWEIECVDNCAIADRHYIARVYENMLAGDIVKSIIDLDLIDEGVQYNDFVQDGLLISSAVFPYARASDALDDIANKIGYYWWIDVEKEMHFQSRETNIAPWEITETSLNVADIAIGYSRSNYVNRQYIRAGNEMGDTRTDLFKGDTSRKTFTLALPCGAVPTITVDSVSKLVGIYGIDEDKDWYWNKGSNQINQSSTGTTLNAGNVLSVTYRGMYPIICVSQLDNEIEARKTIEGGSGIYEGVIDDPNIESSSLALEKANAQLRTNGVIPQQLEYTTIVDGLESGQLQLISLPTYSINGQYLLTNVTAFDVEGKFVRYKVTAIQGDAVQDWVGLYRKLFEQGRKYVIRDNEVVRNLRTSYHNLICEESLSYVVS